MWEDSTRNIVSHLVLILALAPLRAVCPSKEWSLSAIADVNHHCHLLDFLPPSPVPKLSTKQSLHSNTDARGSHAPKR